MNHPDDLPIDIEEMRDWMNGYKDMHNLGWQKLGERIGIPGGTIGPFCTGVYTGRNDRIAKEVFKFRQAERARTKQMDGIPVAPGYFETPTSLRIRSLMAMASTGKITVAALGSGLGKTVTAKDFMERVTPVWMVTMDEVTKKTNAMIRAVEKALGLTGIKSWPSAISADIISYLRKRRGTLIVDEANHLEYGALEQLRSWHDATGVGICLLGNEELVTRIESGRERDAFARLNRRIFQRLVQPMPEQGDVVNFCDAWGITDPGMRKVLMDVALRPGSGGLGECEQIIQAASMDASEDGGRMELAHLKWAVNNRSRRIIHA